MKKYANIIILLILTLYFSSCSEAILDKDPVDRYSDATLWTDPDLASTYLNNVYYRVGHGFRGVMLSDVSDETLNGRGPNATLWHKGIMTADNMRDTYGNPFYSDLRWGNFANVQRVNIFLDKIDEVSENFEGVEQIAVKAETDIMKGEALFLRAWFYTQMCRTYGGLPLMNKANELGDDFSGITRATFEETVNFIVADCDAAAALLPLKADQEMGKATKEAALALKSRILLFAASDLTADGTAASNLVGYSAPNRTALWTAARDAAKAVIDLSTFGTPDQQAVAKNYFEMFKAYDLSDDEIIWGKMFMQTVGTTHRINQTNGPNGIDNFGRNGPFQSMVDEYEMDDGSKFFDHYSVMSINNHITGEDEDLYINTPGGKYNHESPYYDREPRFYASVMYDSCVWQKRFENLAGQDPLGIYQRRTRITYVGGVETNRVYGIDTRNGPVNDWNGTYGGYLSKKYMDDLSCGRDENNKNIWIYLRYAEVILNYAEACLELGDIPTATTYINMIRNRAGLPDFTGDITQAYRHERKVELYLEDIRWFDIRRWKILMETFANPNWGIDITQYDEDGVITTKWKRIEVQEPNNMNEKMYWIPIQTTEIKKAPQLVNNPGY